MMFVERQISVGDHCQVSNCFVIDFLFDSLSLFADATIVRLILTLLNCLLAPGSGDDYPLLDAGPSRPLPQRRPQVGGDGGALGVGAVEPGVKTN